MWYILKLCFILKPTLKPIRRNSRVHALAQKKRIPIEGECSYPTHW